MNERRISININKIERILINNDINGIMTRDENGSDNEIVHKAKNIELNRAENEIKDANELFHKATRLLDDLEDHDERQKFREILRILEDFRESILEDIKAARRENKQANVKNAHSDVMRNLSKETFLEMEGDSNGLAKWA